MSHIQSTPTSPSRWRVGLRSQLLVLLGFILFGAGAYYLITTQNLKNPTFDQKAAQARLERLTKLREEQHTMLHSYGWIDQEAGIVHMPIEKAIPLATAELKKKPIRPGTPITTPPMPVPAPPQPLSADNTPSTPPAPAQTDKPKTP